MQLYRRWLWCSVITATTILWYTQSSPSGARLSTQVSNHQYFYDVEFTTTSKHFGAVSHYDSRFAPSTSLTPEESREVLRALVDSYMNAMTEFGIPTWIAHGTLLSWYWNKSLFPWDTDVDCQMTLTSLETLAVRKNITSYSYRIATDPRKEYLLDINPQYIDSSSDLANKIDARWIDMSNGKFIDITALRSTSFHGSTTLFCKDGHIYDVRAAAPKSELN